MSQRCCTCGKLMLATIHECDEERTPSLVGAVSGAESLRRARQQLRLSLRGSIDSIISNGNMYSDLGGNPFREDLSDVHPGLRTVQAPPPVPPLKNPAREKRLPELSHRLRPIEHQQRPPDRGIPQHRAGESSKMAAGLRFENVNTVAPWTSSTPPEKTTVRAEHGSPRRESIFVHPGYEKVTETTTLSPETSRSRRESVSVHPGYEKAPAARYRTVPLPRRNAVRYRRQSYGEEDDQHATEENFTKPRTVTAQVRTRSSPVNNAYSEARQEEWPSPPHRQTPIGTPSKTGEKYDTPFHTPDDSPTSAEKKSCPMSSSEPLPEDGVGVRDFAQFAPTPRRARAPEQPRANEVPNRITRVVEPEQAPLRSDESTARAADSTPDSVQSPMRERVRSPTPDWVRNPMTDWVETPVQAAAPGATRFRIKRPEAESMPVPGPRFKIKRPEPESTPWQEKPPKMSFRKELSKSLGRAKGKLADIFRDLGGEDPEVARKNNFEVAMRDTKVYLNGFSQKSAFSRDYSLMREVNKVLKEQENTRGHTLPAQAPRDEPEQAGSTAAPGKQDGDDGDKREKLGRRGIFGRRK